MPYFGFPTNRQDLRSRFASDRNNPQVRRPRTLPITMFLIMVDINTCRRWLFKALSLTLADYFLEKEKKIHIHEQQHRRVPSLNDEHVNHQESRGMQNLSLRDSSRSLLRSSPRSISMISASERNPVWRPYSMQPGRTLRCSL